MIKYKDVDQTTESEVMETSGPVFAETFPKKESVVFDKDPDYSPDKDSREKVKEAPQPVQKTIVIVEKNGSISFSIEGQWGSHEAIGALEVVKSTILSKINPQAPSIMDRILMASGIN